MKKTSVPSILMFAVSLGLFGWLWARPNLTTCPSRPDHTAGPGIPEKTGQAGVSGNQDFWQLAQKGSTLKSLRFNPASSVSVQDFLSGRFSSAYGFCETDQWRLASERKDKWGNRHYRLEQVRNGVPVYGMAYLLHEKDGRIVSANGNFLPCSNVAVSPAVPRDLARETAIVSFPSRRYAWQAPGLDTLLQRMNNDPAAGFFPEGELVVLPADLLSGSAGAAGQQNDKLAWRFEIFSLDPLEGREVFVDAVTGELRLSLSVSPNCVEAQGEALYQPGLVDFCVSTVVGPGGAGYRLFDSERNIRTLDNLGQAPDIIVADHFNSSLLWNNLAQRPAVAAHWAMKKTYDYFAGHQQWLHFDNDPGSQTWVWTNYGQNVTNAAKMPFGIVTGNGDGINWGPFVTLDIIAHEYVHGIVENTSKLILYNESGAIHEGLADIFGVVIEMLTTAGSADWKLGEDAHLSDPSTGVRRIDLPNLQKLPDTYRGSYWQDFADCSGPGCSIHHNSTVVSRWFYLLVTGQTGVSENNDLYHVQGIGLAAAADLVFEVMTSYLTPNAGFADFRQAVLLAANDLPGYDLGNLAQAFCAVGIGPCDLTSPDVITVYAPSGDHYFEGDTIQIAWENTGEIDQVDIQISLDNGVTWNPVKAGLNNTGQYDWAAPGYNSDLCRIRVLNAGDPLTFGVSDSFSIRGCNLLAHFMVNDHSPCYGQTIHAENTAVLEGVAYTWLVDSQPASGSPQGFSIHSLSGGAGHTIALIASRGICSDTFRQEITVRNQPSAGFSAVVNNQVISAVADYQEAGNYVWTLNGVVLEGKNAPGFSQALETSGTYTLCLYVNDECGMGPVAPVCEAVTVAETTNCASTEDQVIQFNNTSDIADMVDYGDSLLISTSGGLVFYNKITNQFSVANNANSPLAANHLGSIAVDAEKNIYATLLKGKGLFRIDKTDFSTRNYDIFNLPGLTSNEIRKLKIGPDENLYIITENNGIRVASTSGDSLKIIKSIITLQGLPNKPITDIGFSGQDITWVGTQGGGLVKIAGDQVEDILTFPNGTIHDNWIRTLYADTAGVWFGTYSSKDSLHFWGLDGTHNVYGYGLPGAPPVTIAKGKNGHIYFGVTLNSYLLEFDGSGFTVYNDLGSCCYNKGPVVKIIPDDSENGIWVALKGKLAHWDGAASWNFKNTSLYPFVNNDIDYISLLGEDQIMVSAEYGAASFNGVGFDTLEIGAYLPYQPSSEYLWILDFASEMVEDHLGRKWVAVNFYDAALAFSETNPAFGWTFIKYNELPFSSDINGLLHKDGKLYIGTQADGLWIWELNNFTWTHFDETNSPVWSDYWQGEMAFDHQNRLWLAQKWFSYGGDRLLVYDGNAWNTVQLPATTAGLNLCFHPNGTLFVSTIQNKIWKYDGSDWEELSALNMEINDYSVQIKDIQISHEGDLLIGTGSLSTPVFQNGTFGLIIADTSGAVKKIFNEYNSGLPSSNVKQIKQTSDGTIWVATDNGVAVVQLASEEIIPKFSLAAACQGLPVQISSKTIGANTFRWFVDGVLAGEEKNLVFTFSQAKDYIVTLFAGNGEGCETSVTQIIKVNPRADLTAIDQQISLCDNGTTLSAPEGMQAYAWKSGAQMVGTGPTLDIAQSGVYTLEITDFCGKTAETAFNVLLTTDCVWPGDANLDNRVDIYDWALMGIGFGAFGPPRDEPSTFWTGHPALNWNSQLFPGLNYKHLDTNGDGRIDRADFEAILLHYNRTHGIAPADPGLTASPYAFIPVVTVDAARTNQDTLALKVQVLATHEAGQNLSLYGAAGKLRWDFQGVPVDHIQFSFEQTTLGDPSRELETMYKIFGDEIHFALTRLDHKNQSTVSVIGEAHFLVVDDVVGLGDTLAFSFSVEGPQGLVNSGNFIPLGGTTRNFQFTSGMITGENPVHLPSNEPLFIVYPNPVSEDLNLLYDLDAVREVTFSLFTAHGTEVWRETVRTGQHFQTTVPMSGLPAGMYFLEARTGAGKVIRKVIKI